MDSYEVQALRNATYDETIMDITDVMKKTDIDTVIQNVGEMPEVRLLVIITFCILIVSSVRLWMKGGFNTKIGKLAYIGNTVAFCVLFANYLFGVGMWARMPANDLYSFTIKSEEKEKVLLADGLYQLKKISGDNAAYIITIPNGDDSPMMVSLPKDRYHLEKVIDVETDTLVDLQKALNEPKKANVKGK